MITTAATTVALFPVVVAASVRVAIVVEVAVTVVVLDVVDVVAVAAVVVAVTAVVVLVVSGHGVCSPVSTWVPLKLRKAFGPTVNPAGEEHSMATVESVVPTKAKAASPTVTREGYSPVMVSVPL